MQHQPGFQVLNPGQLPEGEQGGGAGQAGWAGQRLDAEQSEPPLRPPPRLQGQPRLQQGGGGGRAHGLRDQGLPTGNNRETPHIGKAASAAFF